MVRIVLDLDEDEFDRFRRTVESILNDSEILDVDEALELLKKEFYFFGVELNNGW